jgi:prepilin-type N-terminal cleavage/methylation domain-containing protein
MRVTKLAAAWRRLRRENGFSLVELLVTMAILGTVLSGLTTIFVSGSHAELAMNRRFQAQQSVRMALSRVRGDVHAACSASAPAATVVVSGANVAVENLLLTNLDTTVSPPTCTVAAEAWCFKASTQYTGRLALYRVPNVAACPANPGASGVLIGDAISSGRTYFAYSIAATGSGRRDTISVDLPADAAPPGTAAQPVYELTDQIALRNSPRR